jgi:hypothetical protein
MARRIAAVVSIIFCCWQFCAAQEANSLDSAVRYAAKFATGAGTVSSPWVGWEKSVSEAPATSRVVFAAGKYATATGVIIRTNILIEGAGARGTEIIATRPMPFVIGSDGTNARYFGLRSLVVNANHLATNALLLIKPTAFDVPALENVMAKGATSAGVVVRGCQLCTMRGVHSTQNGGEGISLEGCNGSVASGVMSTKNGGDGIVLRKYVEGSTTFSGGMSFYGIDAESNGGHSVNIIDTLTPVSFFGGWIEGGAPGKDGFHITAPVVSISGMRISGKNAGTQGYAVNLLAGAEAADIRGVMLINEAGEFAQIRVAGSIKTGTFEPSVGQVKRQ